MSENPFMTHLYPNKKLLEKILLDDGSSSCCIWPMLLITYMPCHLRPIILSVMVWYPIFCLFPPFFSWWWRQQKSSFYCYIRLYPTRYVQYKGVMKINTRLIQMFICSLVAIADNLIIQNKPLLLDIWCGIDWMEKERIYMVGNKKRVESTCACRNRIALSNLQIRKS